MITAFISLIVICVLLLIDLVSKAIAAELQVNIKLWIFGLTYSENEGIAFGFLSGNPVAMRIITIFTIVLIVLIPVIGFTVFKKNKPAVYALSVIEAGAIGNLVDRLILGYVRDFIDVRSLGFAICNFADFCVTFGAVALVIIILFIGPYAMIPLKKKWRDEAREEQRLEEEREKNELTKRENKEVEALHRLEEVQNAFKDIEEAKEELKKEETNGTV